MQKRFETKLLEEAFEFIQDQDVKVRKKILQNMRRAELNLDPKFFKKLNKEIWEFRTQFSGNQYRLLAFWDKKDKEITLVFATHGFMKKTNKVNHKEIEKANKIRLNYLEREK